MSAEDLRPQPTDPDKQAIQGMRDFIQGRKRAYAREAARFGEEYFDANAWQKRAEWVFAGQKDLELNVLDSRLSRARAARNNPEQRALPTDKELLQNFDQTVQRWGDYDTYVAMFTEDTPETIDQKLDTYWQEQEERERARNNPSTA